MKEEELYIEGLSIRLSAHDEAGGAIGRWTCNECGHSETNSYFEQEAFEIMEQLKAKAEYHVKTEHASVS
jgi:hypothetical protein